ncbi:MAG TPA: hypothetical protein VKT80_11835, partial [Chloroflexota bacterium]|nr:hypothetical protein [Chloroflexota bacterium]
MRRDEKWTDLLHAVGKRLIRLNDQMPFSVHFLPGVEVGLLAREEVPATLGRFARRELSPIEASVDLLLRANTFEDHKLCRLILGEFSRQATFGF